MPPNTVYVGRGSEWGNPFYVGEPKPGKEAESCPTAREAVARYMQMLFPYRHRPPNNDLKAYLISEANLLGIYALRGKNLACWCPIECAYCFSELNHKREDCTHCQGTGRSPCHADELLRIANESPLPLL